MAGRLGRPGRSVREDFRDGVLASEALRLELRAAPIGFVPCLPTLCTAHSTEQMTLNWETLAKRVLRPVLGLPLAVEDIDAVVRRVPFAAETVLVQIQAALFSKMAATGMGQSEDSSTRLREDQCEAFEEAFHLFLHNTKVQQRRRRKNSRRPWYPP